MLKAIFFDNDGVLVDTEHLFFATTQATLAEVGIEVSEAQFIDFCLRQGRSVFELAQERLEVAQVDQLRRSRNERYATRLRAGVPPLDGIPQVLEALYGRVPLAVVTSSDHAHFQIIHAGTGLLRFFDFSVTNRDYERTKPHPDAYLAALARAGCSADEAIAIEDSERGLAAARAAGLRCIVVPHGLTRGGSFDGAYRVLAREEIVAVIEELL